MDSRLDGSEEEYEEDAGETACSFESKEVY